MNKRAKKIYLHVVFDTNKRKSAQSRNIDCFIYLFSLATSLISKAVPNTACTGLVGTVRLFEHFQRPEHFSACRVNQRPAHKPSNANR